MKKLEALGVTIDKSLVNRRASAQADALRERGREREYPDYASSERGFANIDDRLFAQRAAERGRRRRPPRRGRPGRRSFFTEPTRRPMGGFSPAITSTASASIRAPISVATTAVAISISGL